MQTGEFWNRCDVPSLRKSEDKRTHKCITINSLAKNLTRIFTENTLPRNANHWFIVICKFEV